MPAVRDQQQATKFIYTNFYELYRKSKLEAEAGRELAKGFVLHTSAAEVRVVSPEQVEGLQQWSHHKVSHSLRSLRESRKRLKFLMTEIDDILKHS